MAYKLDDSYVDVASRIRVFREKYPDGSLRPLDTAQPWSLVTIGGQDYLVVVAAAFRHPTDLRPGVGMAYERVPGRTPYTDGSELQNAETAAWGRAIVAALAADTKHIASADEVAARQSDRDAEPPWLNQVGRVIDTAPTAEALGVIGVVLGQYVTPALTDRIKARRAALAAAPAEGAPTT